MFSISDFYNKDFEVLKDYENVTVLEIENGGRGAMTFYHIMPGIDVVYNKFSTRKCVEPDFQPYTLNMLEINHCRHGRYGCAINGNDEYIYLGEGEAEVNVLGIKRGNPEFPLGFYEGTEILIDTIPARRYLEPIFPDAAKRLEQILDSVSQNDMAMRIKKTEEFDRIFAELYKVGTPLSLSYVKIKVIEAILIMQTIPFDRSVKNGKYFQKSDIEKVKAIHNEAIIRLDKKLTLNELSEEYGISLTVLKECFREIYGLPYYGYIKRYKMHKAVHYLEQTDLKISEIAGLLGYDNSSKFSAAFKSITGCTPSEYKNNNVRTEHLKLFGVEA